MEQQGIPQERKDFNENAGRIMRGISWAHITSREDGRNTLEKVSETIDTLTESDLLSLHIQGTLENNITNNPDATAENVQAVRVLLSLQHEDYLANKGQFDEAIALFKGNQHD